MARFLWSTEKNNALKAQADRNICFEDIVAAIDSGGLLDDIVHDNKERYADQRILVVQIGEYAYAVPYVSHETGDLFLKTAFPSRKLTQRYLRGIHDGKQS